MRDERTDVVVWGVTIQQKSTANEQVEREVGKVADQSQTKELVTRKGEEGAGKHRPCHKPKGRKWRWKMG